MDRKRILLVLGTGDDRKAEEAAMDFAEARSATLTVLQLLDSRLYHYGRNDVVVPSYARTQFLLHIQENLLRDGAQREAALRQAAAERSIEISVKTIETDDPAAIIGVEAKKGYERIFIPKEKKKLFPLIGRHNLEVLLKKQGVERISAC